MVKVAASGAIAQETPTSTSQIVGAAPSYTRNKKGGYDVWQNGQFQGSVDAGAKDLYKLGAEPQNTSDPLMQRLLETKKRMELREKILTKQKEGMRTQDVLNDIISEGTLKRELAQYPTKEEINKQTLEQSKNQTQEPLDYKTADLITTAAMGPAMALNPSILAGRLTGAHKAGVENVAKNLPGAVSTIAESIDAMRAVISGKRTMKVQTAIDSFSSWNAVLEDDVTLVENGVKSASETRSDINQAIAAIGRLESSTKGISVLNLRYWIDTGASIQAQVEEEKTQLQNMLVKLQLAEQKAMLNSYSVQNE